MKIAVVRAGAMCSIFGALTQIELEERIATTLALLEKADPSRGRCSRMSRLAVVPRST
jgi:hypothetical protein